MSYLCLKGKLNSKICILNELTASRIIEYINKHEGVEWVTMSAMCGKLGWLTCNQQGSG